MPLTYEERLKKVIDAGLDPTKYTYNEPSEQQDTLTPFYPPTPVVPTTSQTETPATTFGRSALRSVVPTGGAMAGLRAGLALPIPHPIGRGIAGIGGALVGGLGGSLLQEKGIEAVQGEEDYKQNLQNYAAGQKENPIASVAGSFLPSLPFVNPLGVVKEAGKLFTHARPSLNKLIAQPAIGGVAQGGIEAGSQYLTEGELDPTRIIASTLLGGALSDPSKLGLKVLGLDVPTGQPYKKTIEGKTGTAEIESSTPIPEVPTKQQPIDLNQQEGIENLRAELQGKEVKPSLADDKTPVVKSGEPEVRPQIEEDYIPDPTEKFYQENWREGNFNKEEGEIKSVPFFGIENERAAYLRDYTGHSSAMLRELKDMDAVERGKKFVKDGPQYDPNTGERLLSEAGPGTPLTPEQLTKANELAAKRGIKFEQQPEIISEVTQQPARGVAIPSERSAAISNLATSDTPAHEVGHTFIRDLRRSTRPADVEFYNRGIKAAGSEEALVQAMGERAVEINNRPLRTWLDDAKNYVGSKVGLVEENPIKGAARRLVDDKPYAESPELQQNISKVEKLYSEVNDLTKEVKNQKEQSASFFKVLEPVVDRLRSIGGRSGPKAADALTAVIRENDRLNGQITYPLTREAKKIKNALESVRYIWETAVFGKAKSIINTADKRIIDEALYPTYRKVHEIQRAEGPKIKLESGALRDAIDNPNRRGPLGVSPAVLETLLKKPHNDVKRMARVKEWVDFHKDFFKIPEKESIEMLNSWLRGMGPSTKSTAHFNALRKAEGMGIPFEWMEKDPVALFNRYGTRVARDLAFFKHIESNPEQRAIWNIQDQSGKPPQVEGIDPIAGAPADTAFKRMTGEHTTSEVTYQTFEHFFRSLFLGPVTGIKNTISTLAQILPYTPLKDLPKAAEAFRYIKKGFAESMEMGVNRDSITSLEVNELGDPVSNVLQNVRRLGDIIRKYTGANGIEQWTRAHNFAMGSLMAEANWGRAANGDIKAKAWLRKFGPEELDFRKPMTDELRKEFAARFVERVQGTYGPIGLPSFLLEPSSPMYWMMSLSKWSVEKSNVIKQDVVNPALSGEDYGPMMRYIFGGLLTGEVIRQVTEELFGGKKASTPNLKELSAKGDVDDWVFKVFELSQLAGLGGFPIDAAKQAMAVGKGYNTQGIGLPTMDIVTNATKQVANASRAIADGQPPLDVLEELTINLTTSTVQAGRVAYNAMNPEEVDRLNKFRDKRVYDKLSGKNIPPYEGGADMYGSLAERKFKRAKTLEEAKEVAETKLKPRMEGMDKDERKNERENLKRNSYQTIPADRKERGEYLRFIEETQGGEAARILLEDKRRQDLVNRRKKSLIPR